MHYSMYNYACFGLSSYNLNRYNTRLTNSIVIKYLVFSKQLEFLENLPVLMAVLGPSVLFDANLQGVVSPEEEQDCNMPKFLAFHEEEAQKFVAAYDLEEHTYLTRN